MLLLFAQNSCNLILCINLLDYLFVHYLRFLLATTFNFLSIFCTIFIYPILIITDFFILYFLLTLLLFLSFNYTLSQIKNSNSISSFFSSFISLFLHSSFYFRIFYSFVFLFLTQLNFSNSIILVTIMQTL